jgi:O-acetyl-ADP-ribose deacetylase (regulator of RNase III)
MKIIYKTGDLFEAHEHFIIHSVNMRGKMGKGVAKIVRDRYPYAYDAYMLRHKSEGLRLGTTIWAKPPSGDGYTIINAVTQDDYRRHYEDDGVQHANYDAIRSCFRQINNTAIFSIELNSRWLGHPIDAIAMPLISAGLAGGDWPTIAAIIEEESTAFQPIVYRL